MIYLEKFSGYLDKCVLVDLDFVAICAFLFHHPCGSDPPCGQFVSGRFLPLDPHLLMKFEPWESMPVPIEPFDILLIPGVEHFRNFLIDFRHPKPLGVFRRMRGSVGTSGQRPFTTEENFIRTQTVVAWGVM